MKKKFLLLTLSSFLFINFLFAQTWDGSASTDWNTAANWSTNAVPTTTGDVIIPSSLATYPILASNVTINSINMQAGSQLDFKGFTLTINTTSQYNYFTGATLNNSNAGSDIVVNINTGGGGYSEYVRSTTVNDNITFNLSGTNAFYEADNAGTANTYMGNVTFNINSTLGLYLSDNGASQYNGNLVINRPAGGATQIFNGGGDVTGNFSFTNNIDGSTLLGNAAKKTTISGTITVAINQVTPAAFQLLHIVNQTTGGTINAQNTQGFNVQKDTLNVSTFSVTGYRGANYGYFYNNDITGNITIADDATYAGGYGTYIRYNEITGNATFTNNGSNVMNEADVAGSGNHYTGNVSFTCAGSGPLYISDSDTSYYDGNLSLNRTATGVTQGFNSGGVIGGNFSFTNNTAGNALFGNLSTKTSIGGTVNISLNDVTPGNFQLHHIINQTTGGTINAQNTQGFTVQKDTLKVTAFSVTGYRGPNYGYFYNNDITGNITIADDATYAGGYATYIRYNEITGNATFTNNGSNTMYDADIANSGNKYSGDVSYIKTSGLVSVASADTTSFGKNLTLNSSSGITLNRIKFVGNTNGIIQQLGAQPVNITSFTMEKTGTGTLTLNDTVTVTNNLNLNSGIIITGTGNTLVIPDGVTYTGGSDQSYVNGSILKTGNDAFVFPLGQNNVFAPISITAPVNVTDEFRGQYIADVPNNAGYDSTKRDPTLNHISSKEYWLLDRTGGTSNVKVTLSWDKNRSGVVNDVPNLRVARWNGSIWTDEGNGVTTGNNMQGTVQSLNTVTNFSPFTLASTNALNPLPITLLNFTATRCDDNVCLQWSTENEKNASHFEIERASRDNDFKLTGSVNVNNNRVLNNYAFSDKTPGTGVNFYRLKIIDADGSFTYSKVLPVIFDNVTSMLIYPNPVRDEIRILSPKNIISIEISDLSGRLIKAMAANSTNRYNVSELQKGLYIVKVKGDDNTIVSKKLIIQ